MQKQYLLAICLLFAIFIAYSQSIDPKLSHYKLKFNEDSLRVVDIEATLYVREPFLKMNRWGIPPEIPGGWAEFVDIRSISYSNGQPIPFHWNDSSKAWDVPAAKNCVITVAYRVRLEHDNYNWDAGGGIDGRPTVWNNEVLFWVTKALFVYGQGTPAELKAEIVFELPKDWKISTPWMRTSDNGFLAESLDMLDNNLLVVGNQIEDRIQVDGMSILLVTPSSISHRMELLRNTMKAILPVYKQVFKELPGTNYLICVSKNEIEDGEAYANSFHQMFNDKNLKEREIVWANTFAHEMFHYWTGIIYNDNFEGNYWFSEGFTDYYSSLALIRSNTVSEQDYLKKLAFQFARFHSVRSLMREKVSLIQAGHHKIENWHLIYGGGATIAFVLDVEIRSITEGRKSLDDFMERLYVEFGKKGNPFTIEDQIRILNQLTNSDFGPIFKKYIQGTEPVLDLITIACEKAGLAMAQYQSEFYLTPKEESGDSIYKELIAMDKE